MATALDILPTFARICGQKPPGDRTIDGHDILPLLTGASSRSPCDVLFYYFQHELQALRKGDWKLHLRSGELYNLKRDIAETTDLASERPDIVKSLQSLAAECRKDLGDSLHGVEGSNRRPCGHVANPRTLTRYDTNHPYMVAMYD
jgi:arylsulfatase A-like enzyme